MRGGGEAGDLRVEMMGTGVVLCEPLPFGAGLSSLPSSVVASDKGQALEAKPKITQRGHLPQPPVRRRRETLQSIPLVPLLLLRLQHVCRHQARDAPAPADYEEAAEL